jgi:hypothetical protein
MTAQFPDRLIVGGAELDLCSLPLEDYLRRIQKLKRPPFVESSTALWRGYVATWEIRDGLLWLVKIDGCLKQDQESVQASIETAFPKWKGPVHAF